MISIRLFICSYGEKEDSPVKKFNLRGKFRIAVLTGLAALGIMATNTSQGAAKPKPFAADNTQLVTDSCGADVYATHKEFQRWDNRQDSFLDNDTNCLRYEAWLSKLDGAEDLPLLRQMQIVDSLVNRTVTWTSDSAVYNGAREYWAPGAQTVLSGKGDCDDFAIAKFYALRHLGVPESRLGILVVATDSAAKEFNHAVLALDTSASNTWLNSLVLDNDGGNTRKTIGKTGYKPFYLVSPGEIRSCTLKKRTLPTASSGR